MGIKGKERCNNNNNNNKSVNNLHKDSMQKTVFTFTHIYCISGTLDSCVLSEADVSL